MKKLIYIGIFFCFFIMNISYAAVTNVEAVDSDLLTMITITADAEDAEKNAYIHCTDGTYTVKLLLHESGAYSQASFYVSIYGDEYYLDSSEPVPEGMNVWISKGHKNFDCGIIGDDSELFVFEYTIPGIEIDYVWMDDLSPYDASLFNFATGAYIYANVDETWTVGIEYCTYSGNSYSIGEYELSSDMYYDGDSSFWFTIDLIIDKFEFLDAIAYDVQDIGYMEIRLYKDDINQVVAEEIESFYFDVYPEIDCWIYPSGANENHKFIEANVDYCGLGLGELFYCITSEPYLSGDENWILAEDSSYLFTEVLASPRVGHQYIHFNAMAGASESYKTIDLTNYKVWTGDKNNYTNDDTSVSYSNGIITLSGTIYSNTPGTYKIEALNNSSTFTVSGSTVYIANYDPDASYCYCHEYWDSGYGDCSDCYEPGVGIFFDGEWHNGCSSCNSVDYGYKYTYTMKIDAKKAGITEGNLTSITYSISRRNEATYLYDVMKEDKISTSLYIDLTTPTISIYGVKGSGSNRSYLLRVSDNSGLMSYSLFYDFVEADFEGDFNYKQIYLYKDYKASSTEYIGEERVYGGVTNGYVIVTTTIPENEIMRYRVVLKATDIYGNTTEYISSPYDCGDYAVNLTYKVKDTGEVIKQKVIETNASQYTLTLPSVVELDGVTFNRLSSNWASAVFASSKSSALSSISGDVLKCISFSSSNHTIDVTIYLEDIKYRLYEYEEVDLTAKLAQKLGISLNLYKNNMWPAGVYNNKLYFGYVQSNVIRISSSRKSHDREMYLISYDIKTGEMKYIVLEDNSATSWKTSYNDWMDIKILTKPYTEYRKAVDLEGSVILMEDGSAYQMTYYAEDDDYYNAYTYRLDNVVELLPEIVTFDGYRANMVRTKNGDIYALYWEGSTNTTATFMASNAKVVTDLVHDYDPPIRKDIIYTYVVLYNNGSLKLTNRWWWNGEYGTTRFDVETSGVIAFKDRYYLKNNNGVYEIYDIDLTDIDKYATSLLYSSTTPILEENFYGNMIVQNGNLYNISSGSKKLICSDVKEVEIYGRRTAWSFYTEGYVLTNSGEVYDIDGTQMSGLSSIEDICDGFAKDSSGKIYEISTGESTDIITDSEIKRAVTYSGATFILLENGDLYIRGWIPAEGYNWSSTSKIVYVGGDECFEKKYTGVKDLSIDDVSEAYDQNSVKIITSDGEVLGVGNLWYGGFVAGGSRTNWRSDYTTGFRDVDNIPTKKFDENNANIWMSYWFSGLDQYANSSFATYDFNLNEKYKIDNPHDEETEVDFVYARLQENIPSKYIHTESSKYLNGVKITPSLLRRADLEKKVFDLDKNLDIFSDIILEKGEGENKKYGVICKKSNGDEWDTYKIVWFKIEEKNGIDIKFALEEEAKTFEQGIVYLDYNITVTEEVDLYFNDIINNMLVTKDGQQTSGAEKVLLRLQRSTGEIVPLNLDTAGKMKISSGSYKLTVVIGGVDCFTKITTGGDGYLLKLNKLRFAVRRNGQWVQKSAELKLVKSVEVIDLVDVT